MNQLTIRGIDSALEERIRALARAEGISLNQAVLRLLRRGAGVGGGISGEHPVGSSLDHLAGTFSRKEADLLLAAIEDFERIDAAIWE